MYLQKTHQITRREFADMLREQAISLNEKKVTWFDEQLKIGDVLTIDLPDGENFSQTIESFPIHRPRLVLFHKPVGYVVSKADKHNKTIYDMLPERRHKELYYIGRLDKESSWLLLLTNDTKLVEYYEHPGNSVYKVYEVQIKEPFKSKDIQKCTKWFMVTPEGDMVYGKQDVQEEEAEFKPRGDHSSRYNKSQRRWNQKQTVLSGGRTPARKGDLLEDQDTEQATEAELLKCVSVSYQPDSKGRHRLVVVLDQGKNRQIRRMLKALKYTTLKLHRIKIGKRRLGDIKPGKWKIETKRLS